MTTVSDNDINKKLADCAEDGDLRQVAALLAQGADPSLNNAHPIRWPPPTAMPNASGFSFRDRQAGPTTPPLSFVQQPKGMRNASSF